MNRAIGFPLGLMALLSILPLCRLVAAEFHVASHGGDDLHAGTVSRPWRTIQHAADLAQPGDTIIVHRGIYRERINPRRGGDSDARRIVYQAAPGEAVEIRGSEVVSNWVEVAQGVWKTTVKEDVFSGGPNPYREPIRGDWFEPKGREHHSGAVYLDGRWLVEAARLEDVLATPEPAAAAGGSPGRADSGSDPGFWYARAEPTETTLWARFSGSNPNQHLTEINVRRTVFYPDQPGRNFITVRGFTLRHAATPWAPPTAEQIGLIGTHWSKGWIIEDNVISHSVCSGIALGKYGDAWDNTSANTAEGYVKTIERALANGWNRETIGHHVVRNNTISHCEQAGIVGSLGAAFSSVTGNTIHDIHVRRLFTGAEMAGIKFHAAIDTVIRSNHIHRTCLGLWLDWMAQGTRVSGNLFHDNSGQDLFVEVNHGPFLVDHNVFLSPVSVLDMSEGGAYAHNLFLGRIISRPEPTRETPYHPPHTTAVAGLARIRGGDNAFFNNVFVGPGSTQDPVQPGSRPTDPEWRGGHGLWVYDFRDVPLRTGGNVYFAGARPWMRETDARVVADGDPGIRLETMGGRSILRANFEATLAAGRGPLVTTAVLGKASVSGLSFENADGTPVRLDADLLGRTRDTSHPTPGPWESPDAGPVRLRVR